MKKTKDFIRMATKGRSVFGPYATMRIRKIDNGKEEAKIAFIISTKIFKRAVKRNRAKRRFRTAVHQVLESFPKGYHIIFILKPNTLDAPMDQMREEVSRMLEKVPEIMQKPIKLSPRAKKEFGKGKIRVGARFVKPRRNKRNSSK